MDCCTVRPLKIEDFGNGFFETLSRLRPVTLTQRDAEIVFESMSLNPCHHIFVGEHGGKVVGTITCLIEHKFIHGGGIVLHIEDVAVHKQFGGRGIGRQLVKHAVEFGRQHHCYKVVLDCDDHMVPYYQGCGFYRNANAMRVDL